MDAIFQPLLACPACAGALTLDWRCASCDAAYAVSEDVADLRLPGDERTETVRAFYTEAPFPGYPPHASLSWLRARAGLSPFARALDRAIAPDARIAEIGCGTGQMSLYLAHGDRVVIGADLTRASLLLATGAAKDFGIGRALFVETDLFAPGLRDSAFDVVYCSGVLHHTPDPRAAFRRIARLARPGGMIVIGLYNGFARIPLRLRRIVARLTAGRWIPGDPVLKDRTTEAERHRAWLRDQYCHPLEHCHTLAEVRRWFGENGITYVRSYPSALLGGSEADALLADQTGGWFLEEWITQCKWMTSIGREGGLFVTVGIA
ncbi:class I SAM-dependent methyltransferase [Sphingobium sp. EM0848]|uniref:class I SAM-dependent methyltransferase n=1 Tax=Sphingobium sp. EM0848 TaxID=2743473 RepID=UPI00159C8387|nr:class I SAM-dependent methyltransferase [Sphingobium sp. EM0848]